MSVRADERQALGNLCEVVDCDRVWIHREKQDVLRATVLRLSGNRAVTLGNHVFLPDGQENLAVLAHELTHCGQYQSWGALVYYGRAVADRVRDLVHISLGACRSPYDYVVDGKSFREYGMEQQGKIVEDCYRGDAAARAVSPFRPPPHPDCST